MAHDLKDGHLLRAHQALHGYSDGHRLLSCSTTLKPKEQKTMLVMSDVSGSGAVIGNAGYLTGYPLVESGLYALARTWSATELPRPGCVWTHTLLLDFADLAFLPTMDAIVNAFRRPQGTQPPRDYDTTVTLGDTPLPSTLMIDDEYRESLRHLLWALYEQPKERIVAEEIPLCEELVLSLWSQQWPRLRRTFRFCTLAFGDRSVEGASFDLQFLPSREPSIRSRFSTATDAGRLYPATAQWLEDALLDLSQGVSGRLRSFLRQMGGDVAGGREAFIPLCRLHSLLDDLALKPEAIDAAVTLIEDAFDTESAKSARTIVISTAANRPGTLSDHALGFVMQHLDLLATDQHASVGERLGGELWSRDPDSLIRLLAKEPQQKAIAEHVLARLSAVDLVKSLRRTSGVEQQILSYRPDLVGQPEFWTLNKEWQAQGLAVAAKERNRSQSALAAMLAGNRTDLVAAAVGAFDGAQLLQAVDLWLSEKGAENPSSTISAWLDAALVDAAVVAKALSNKVVRFRALLIAIARRTDPDFVPNDFGEDPWWTAVHGSKDESSEQGWQYLSAYLMARALGNRSRSPAELLAFVFDEVYFAALRSHLTNDAWRLLSPRLPWSNWWFDWDHCRRMRAAIVEAFVDRDLSPATFGQITTDDNLFAQLAESVAANKRGRRFLRNVRDALKEMNPDHLQRRISILEELM
jgi:hypothetical protein